MENEKIKLNENLIISKNYKDCYLLYTTKEYYLFIPNKYDEPLKINITEKPSVIDKSILNTSDKSKISNMTGINGSLIVMATHLETAGFTDIKEQIDIINELFYDLSELEEANEERELLDIDSIDNVTLFKEITDETLIKKINEISDKINKTQKKNNANNTIENQIKERIKPILTKKELTTAKEVKKQLKKSGLINHLNKPLNAVQVGEHKNIYRKSLAEFNIMRGKGSYLSETTAKAEAGKSFEDEIVWEIITPPRYIKKINDITEASFKSYSDQSPYYFSRLTVLFGDFGSKQSFKRIEPVFNMIKPLITENEYYSSKMEKGENDWENKEIHLKVESIGGVYSTTLNSFTEDDNQLISRTINSTPAPVDAGDIIDHIDNLEYSGTKQSKARKRGIKKLKDFGIYMMSLVNYETEIINPYKDIFKQYALKSDNPIREFQQQKELFNSYCILTNYDCEKIDGYTVASIKQLNEYMNEINLENALIPYEYDFLKMIMADGGAYQLTMVRDIDYAEQIKSIESKQELSPDEIEVLTSKIKEEMASEDVVSLIECENNVFELMGIYREDLTPQQMKDLHNKLHNLYGLRSRSDKFTGTRAFFKFNDLKYVHGRKSAYKNIDNVSKLLKNLEDKGYVGKYDYKESRTSDNLYYITPKCKELLSQLNIGDSEFKTYWNEYKERTGL